MCDVFCIRRYYPGTFYKTKVDDTLSFVRLKVISYIHSVEMRFCPKCSYFLYLDAADNNVSYQCRSCGHRELLDPKTKEDALILETAFRSGASATGAASGVTVNAFTLMDPTLPHLKNLRCPNGVCPSRSNETLRDIIYIKTDPVNMKFQYVCTVCKQQFTN
jgi:DNA-directed RNA polymerase subunit RPC12/RpoP